MMGCAQPFWRMLACQGCPCCCGAHYPFRHPWEDLRWDGGIFHWCGSSFFSIGSAVLLLK